MKLKDRTLLEPRLYGASADQLLARVRAVDHQVTTVLVIAHNPGLQDLALELAGDAAEIAPQLREKFPTGALAEVLTDCEAWSDLARDTARVISLVVPRDLAEQ
jgi:phosphohistidine phosphatase